MNRLGDSYRYKNSNPKIIETREIQKGLSPSGGGVGGSRLVAASAIFDAFVNAGNDVIATSRDGSDTGSEGDALGQQRLAKTHSDQVTDIAFSPFNDFCLATAAKDQMLKLWTLSSSSSSSSSSLSIPLNGPIASFRWHPAASGVIAAAVNDVAKIVDAEAQEVALEMEASGGKIQSLAWGRGNGSVLATTSADKMLRLFDPRASATPTLTISALASPRDSACTWLGSSDRILVSSLAQDRKRQIAVWDIKAGKMVKTENFDVASGLLIPLFDVDTEMTFLYGRGSSFLHFYHLDVQAASSSSSLQHCATWHADSNIIDAALTPKRGLHLMEAEVNRVVVLTRNALMPVSWIPARKNYKEFHEDLFPPTRGSKAGCDAGAWRSGDATMAADAALRPGKKVVAGIEAVSSLKDEIGNTPEDDVLEIPAITPGNSSATPTTVTTPTAPKPSPLAGLVISKFKHLKMDVGKKSRWIENLPDLSMVVPGHSDIFAVNKLRFAVPLKGARGSRILVVDFGVNFDGKRLQDVGLPTIENGVPVVDLVFSPFDDSLLLTASEDGMIREWKIPQGGIKEQMTKPTSTLQSHTEKLYFVRFHPLVSDVVASSSYDMTFKLWNWKTKTPLFTITDFDDEVFCCCFSYLNPNSFVTVSKDKTLRKFHVDPSLSSMAAASSAVVSASVSIGQRGARCFFACDDQLIVVSAFSRQSHRQLAVYDAETLEEKTILDLDANPSILVPYYDVDTGVVFLTGRGDSLVLAFQVVAESPYLLPLSHASIGGASGAPLHQSLGFFPKNICDVANVEIAKGMRLCPGVLQPLSITVPRIKMEFFQDDIFPAVTPTWIPATSVEAFQKGDEFMTLKKYSLKPAHMKALSEAPIVSSTPKKYDFGTELKKEKSEEAKKEELLAAMSDKLELDRGKPLPQDQMDGVDSDEWED